MTDSENFAEAVRILQRMEAEWIGPVAQDAEGYLSSWPLPVTFVIHAMALCLFWDYGLRLWKYWIYVKNHKDIWIMLAAFLLPCGVASADTTTGKVCDYDLFANFNSTGGSVSTALTQVGSVSITGERATGFSSANYLSLPSLASMAGDSSWSVSLWAKAPSGQINHGAFSIGGAAGGTSIVIYPAHSSGGNHVRVWAFSNYMFEFATSAAVGSDAHLVVVVESSSVAKLYVNGTLAATTSSSLALPGTMAGAAIGTFHGGTTQAFSGGSVGQVKIFNRALSAGDVADLRAEDIAEMAAYRNPAPVNTSPPVVRGTMEVGETLTVSDGTWTGATSFSYQWYMSTDDAGEYSDPISGATSSTFTLTEDQVGLYVFATVTATGAGGSVEASSPIDPESPVAPFEPGPTGDWGDCEQCGHISIEKIELRHGEGAWYDLGGGWALVGPTCESVIHSGGGAGGPTHEDADARFTLYRWPAPGGVCDSEKQVIIVPDLIIGPGRAFEIGHPGSCDDEDGDCQDDDGDCDDDQDGTPDKDEDDDDDGIANDDDDDDDDDGCKDNEECEDDDEDGTPNCRDADDDNDGTADWLDCDWHGKGGGCWDDDDDDGPQGDPDDDGVPNHTDSDDDGDGLFDWDEDDDEDGTPNGEDDDDDNDGTPDEFDEEQGGQTPEPGGGDEDVRECEDGFGIDRSCCAGADCPPGLASCCAVGGTCDDGLDCDGGGDPDPPGDGEVGCFEDWDCDDVPDDEDDDDDNDGTPDDEDDDDTGCTGDNDCDGTPDDEDDDDDNDGTPDDDDEDPNGDGSHTEDPDGPGGSGCECCDDLLHELRGIKGLLDVEGAEMPDPPNNAVVPSHIETAHSESSGAWYQWWRASGENVEAPDTGHLNPPVKFVPGVATFSEWGMPVVGAPLQDYEFCLSFGLVPDTSIGTETCIHTLPLENLEAFPDLEGLLGTIEQMRVWLRRLLLIFVIWRAWNAFAGLVHLSLS